MRQSIKLFFIFQSLSFLALFVGCAGCKSNKDVKTSVAGKNVISKTPQIAQKISVDTTSQDWKNKNYFYGTNIPLPDSIKINTPRLGKDVWVSQYKYVYKPIQYDDRNDPKVKFLKIYFVDSLSNDTSKSINLIDKNPYKDLPFENIESIRDRNVWGTIRYDLRNANQSDINSFLLRLGVNNTNETKISFAEVMTGTYDTEEAETIAVAYAIMVKDEEGKIVANQTTYFTYDKFGNQIGQLFENGHGLYQCAITKDGKYLAAAFGGRFGCGNGEYIEPYFKIFDISKNKVVHHQDLKFSNGLSAVHNYFVLNLGGGKGTERIYGIFHISSNKYYEKVFPKPIGTQGWNENSALIEGVESFFDTQEYTNKPFNPQNSKN